MAAAAQAPNTGVGLSNCPRFRSPWPSAGGHGFLKFFKARLLEWNEVPLPTHGLDELVQAVQAAQLPPGKVAVTWLG